MRSPVKVNGGLPMSLSPGLGAACCAGTAGGNPPPLPPPPPPPPPGGTPPGIPGFPPPGVLADWMGNPHPVNDCGGSG